MSMVTLGSTGICVNKNSAPPPPAMQQSLKHIDLPLQLIDTPYLLSNQQAIVQYREFQ